MLTTQSLCLAAFSQNVGIGTITPTNKLEVVGNLLVNEPLFSTNTAPTASQTKNMIENSTILFAQADSTGIMYDPAGPVLNYLPNLTANAYINSGNHAGIQIIINDIELGTGDSLIIQKNSDPSAIRFLAVGNGYSTASTHVFNSPDLFIIFKSNADNGVGRGFSLLFKRLYRNSPVSDIVKDYAGHVMFFDTKRSAFRTGVIGIGDIGSYSNAMGYQTSASGVASTAMGYQISASGSASTAIGFQAKASGAYSTAMGFQTTASGDYSTGIGYLNTSSGFASTAMGYFNRASGSVSTAMGYQTTASGAYSTAMGYNVTTNGQHGSFIIGDYDTSRDEYYNDVRNQMQMVFAGGYKLYTGLSSSGVYMNGGDNSWSAISDSTKKEKVLPVDGEDFLHKIAQLKLGTWNYKGQDSKSFRHYGPMAQDFHQAFGKDALGTIGCDTLINQQDFLGVNLIAIQALEKRTAKLEELQKQNTALQNKIKELEDRQKENDDLKNKLDELTTSFKLVQLQMTSLISNKSSHAKQEVANVVQ